MRYTHIALVLDRSGSMWGCWDATCESIAKFVEDQREGKGKCTFTLNVFDSQIDNVCDFVDIQDAPTELGVNPRGATRLCDAIGHTVNETKNAIDVMLEEEKPSRLLLVIQTDGGENASREYDRPGIKKLLDTVRNEWQWEVLFLGADESSIKEAEGFGLDASKTVKYSKGKSGQTFNSVSAKTMAFRNAATREEAARSVAYTDDEKESLT